MTDVLLQHITRYFPLNDETAAAITGAFDTCRLHKKELLLSEGELCPRIYFVVKGCLRLFYLDEKGTEHTIQFALENWWMTDLEAFNKKGVASFSIQAIEPSTVLAISKPNFDALLQNHPALEKYFRIIYERGYSASLFRMKYFRLSKDEFYAMFCASYPEFVQRIPQKLLASFLGFTPEYLSELRKKMIS